MLPPLSRRSRASVQSPQVVHRQRTTFGTWGSQAEAFNFGPAGGRSHAVEMAVKLALPRWHALAIVANGNGLKEDALLALRGAAVALDAGDVEARIVLREFSRAVRADRAA